MKTPSAYHDTSPGECDEGKERTGTNLSAEDSGGRLEDHIRGEKHQGDGRLQRL